MKILLFACVWERPHITQVFAAGVRRLQKSFDIEPLTVCSNIEDYELCKSLNLNPIWIENTPLGKKHNGGLAFALDLDWSHLLLLGSDDLLSTEGLDILVRANKLHCGFRKMVAYESRDGQMVVHEYPQNTRIIGAGRLIHRGCLEATYRRTIFTGRFKQGKFVESPSYPMSVNSAKYLEYRGMGKKGELMNGCWDSELNRDLDNSLDKNMALCGFPSQSIESEQIHIIDVKSGVGINQFGAIQLQFGNVTPYTGEWDWFLSDEEKQMLEKLKISQ